MVRFSPRGPSVDSQLPADGLPLITMTASSINYSLRSLPAPLVTAVMVTGKSPFHESFARVAVDCFLAQTYVQSELVVVNDGPYTLSIGDPRVREIRPESSRKLTLGELRNVGLEHARGDWIIQWDDDDYHHIHRIAMMMAHRRENACVMLGWQIRVNLPHNKAFTLRERTGIAGTILHPKSSHRYKPVGRDEDALFWTSAWGDNRVVVDNAPDRWPGPAMYVRLWHGMNTWDEAHVMAENMPGLEKFDLNEDQAEYIRTIVPEYGIGVEVTRKPL